jgi:Na+/melibiose symporter-like transporter
MIRMLIRFAVWWGAAAIGLFVAKLVLDDMTIDVGSFVFVALIFALIQTILSPFFMKTAARNAPSVLGGVGLLTTFVALLITEWVSDGMSIVGVETWIFATLIVWIATMLATLLLPMIVGRRALERSRDRRS